MLDRLFIYVLAAWVALAPMLGAAPALASQNTLQMPTTGTVSGLQFSNKVTDALDSLVTCNSGGSAPVNAAGGAPKLGQCWIDTSNSSLPIKKRYTGAAWVAEGVLDVVNGLWLAPVGGGVIAAVTAASTTDLCAAPSSLQSITGATTIASFGSTCPAGVEKTLVFASTPTVTYNATSMILPAARDFTAAAGDVVKAVSLGSGNWRVIGTALASGQAVINPAVDVGVALMNFGDGPPSAKFVLGYGQALTRADYPDYLARTTRTQTGVRTSGSAVLATVSDTSRFRVGMAVEGTGIPAATTIASFTSSSVTLSANATSSGTSNFTVFFYGYGSAGTTATVGVPDCRSSVLAGRDDMGGTARGVLTSTYFGSAGASGANIGAFGGAQSQTLDLTQLPNATLTASANFLSTLGSLTVQSGTGASVFASVASSSQPLTPLGGSGAAHTIVQPTVIADCMIRVLP